MVVGVLIYAAFVIGSAAGVLGGIGLLLLGFHRFEEARAIRTTPPQSPGSVPVGPAAIEGRIEAVGPTIGSIYGCEACVAYELEVSDVGSESSETHVERSEVVRFDIVTDDGSIRVEDASFDFHVSEGRQWSETRESYESPDEELRRFERDWSVPEPRAGDKRTYRASYLCPGDRVYAYGTVDTDESRQDERAKPLVLTDRGDLFFISDRDREALLRDRRFALAKDGILGVVLATVSLAVFLWLTGIAQVFLGA